MTVKDSESNDTMDSEVEPQTSESTDSNTETELSDSTQSGSSEYLTCEEVLESDRGTPDGSSEGEDNSVSELNGDMDQYSGSYECMGRDEINANHQDI